MLEDAQRVDARASGAKFACQAHFHLETNNFTQTNLRDSLHYLTKVQRSSVDLCPTNATTLQHSSHTNTANMSAEGVQDPSTTAQVGNDTPMDAADKGKGKAPSDDAMDEDDSSEDDEEVRRSLTLCARTTANTVDRTRAKVSILAALHEARILT